MNARIRLSAIALATALVTGVATPSLAQNPNTLLNVSYDIARELYVEINAAFIKHHKAKTGQDITINQSHNGSSRQARSILEGLEADVVTFNQVTDVQVLHDRGKLIPKDWQKRLPNNSSPYYSLPAFLVRAGNPKNIKDWDDLVRSDVKVIFPNPKTSGNARYTYLAAYAYAKARWGEGAKTDDFIKQLFNNVPVFDTGGRAATTTFVERQTGDVLITFEAETNAIRDLVGKDKVEAIVPSISVLAEFPVAVVDKFADKHGTRALADRLPRIPLLRGRPDHPRQAIQPREQREGRGPVQGQVPGGEAGQGRGRVRRLGQGQQGPSQSGREAGSAVRRAIG